MADEELKIDGPGGIGFAFKGSQMFPVLLVILLGLIFGYLFFTHDNKDDARSVITVAAIKELKESTAKAESTQRAMIYVLSLSQEERQHLNLMKPKELSEMQR